MNFRRAFLIFSVLFGLTCEHAHSQSYPLNASNNLSDLSNPAAALSNLKFTILNIRAGCTNGPQAVGNGTTDDSAAIAACVNLANTLATAGNPVAIYAPGGNYLIKATKIPTINKGKISLRGDGVHITYFTVDPAYSYGAVFSWSESWYGTSPFSATSNTSNINVATDSLGAHVEDFTISGTTNAPYEQDALVFYDRNDLVTVQHVDINYMHGQCLSIGQQLNKPLAYMRESVIFDLRCNSSGTTAKAAIEIAGSAVNPPSDSTNQLKVYDVNIFFATGTGMLIHAPTVASGVGSDQFIGLRIEDSGYDDLDIGAPSDLGNTPSGLDFYATRLTSPGQSTNGYYALWLGGSPASQGYSVNFYGLNIGPCLNGSVVCNGIKIDEIRLSHLLIGNLSVNGTAITYTTNAGTNIVVDNAGNESALTYSYPASPPGSSGYQIHTPVYYTGDPTQSSAGIDLQQSRDSPTQTTTGTNSALLGGSNNAVSGMNSAIVGGNANLLAGPYGFMGGGNDITDRGRGGQTYGTGIFSILGDAQVAKFVMRCAATAGGNCRLTSDAGAPGATNCVNVAPGHPTSYGVSIRLHAKDYTTTGSDYDWVLLQGFFTTDAGAATTQSVIGTPSVLTRGTVAGASVAATADATNGCINLTFTAPTSGTDVWHAVAKVETVEVQ